VVVVRKIADVEGRLIETIHARLGSSPEITDPLSSLGVDSLRLAGFVSDLEEVFGIRADQDIFDVETVQELADYIRDRMRGGQEPG
jgi:acyl carrier protein